MFAFLKHAYSTRLISSKHAKMSAFLCTKKFLSVCYQAGFEPRNSFYYTINICKALIVLAAQYCKDTKYIFMCMHVCMYVCIYLHTHTYKHTRLWKHQQSFFIYFELPSNKLWDTYYEESVVVRFKSNLLLMSFCLHIINCLLYTSDAADE